MEKGKKNTHSRQISRGGTGTEQSGTGTISVLFFFSVLTSVGILAITCSFIIRFKSFKWLVKIDCKENKTSGNRYLRIRTLYGPKIHSKRGMFKKNFCFSFDHRIVRVVKDITRVSVLRFG